MTSISYQTLSLVYNSTLHATPLAINSPHPHQLRPATRPTAADGPPVGDGSGREVGPGADAGMRAGAPWDPGTRHDSDSARARNPLVPLIPRQAQPDPPIQPGPAGTRQRCVTRIGPGPEAGGVARAACPARPDKHPAASCTGAEHAHSRAGPSATAQPARTWAHGTHGADGHEPRPHAKARRAPRPATCSPRHIHLPTPAPESASDSDHPAACPPLPLPPDPHLTWPGPGPADTPLDLPATQVTHYES